MSPDQKFKQDVQMYMKMGYDQNQATALAQGLPADGPPKPTPPPPPQTVKPVDQVAALSISKGQGVKPNTQAKKKTKQSDLRIADDPVEVAASYSSGLNFGGY